MFSGLQEGQLKGALEAMLFVTDEPVSTITLADMIEVEPSEVECALVDLRAQFEEENRGIQLREVAGGWRLFTHPVYHELIERYVLSWDTRRLSQAAMETLAIIAYSQPVTRAGVAAVRGVNSDSSINSLVEKGLVREAGNEDAPGNPILYATTRTFLEKFGLRSVDDLPDIQSYAPDEETRAFISDRLSTTRGIAVDVPGEGEGLDIEGLDDPIDGIVGAGMDYGRKEKEAGEVRRSLFPDGKGRSDSGQPAPPPEGPSAEAASQAPPPEGPSAEAFPADLLAQALASSMDVVEKIDFDDLEFEE